MPAPISTLISTATAVAKLGVTAEAIGELDDAALLDGHKIYVALTRQVDTHGAWIAGEIDRRSRYVPGRPGLAKKQGFPNAGILIQSASGSTAAEADKLIKTGVMLAEVAEAERIAVAVAAEAAAKAAMQAALAAGLPEPAPLPFNPLVLVAPSPEALWQAPIVAEVAAGSLSAAQADGIRAGLGVVAPGITALMLLGVVADLLEPAIRGTAAGLQRLARQQRDRLDTAGVARKEIELRGMQYFTAKRRADGLVTGSFAFAGVDGALLLAVFEQSVAPHTVDPDIPALEDTRSRGLKAADHFINLIQVGLDVDAAAMPGTRHPSVRIIVENSTLAAREADPHGPIDAGTGVIQETLDAVSLAIVEAALCDTGMVGVQFDSTGQCLDVGRDQRLFTRKQKIALVARDGGCLGPYCDKPPSFTEAHHINYWGRDKGRTDIADGVLLCRQHHQLFHAGGWEIFRINDRYWLQPPKKVDPQQRHILLVSNSPIIRAMIAKNHQLAQIRRSPDIPTETAADGPPLLPGASAVDRVRSTPTDELPIDWPDPNEFRSTA